MRPEAGSRFSVPAVAALFTAADVQKIPNYKTAKRPKQPVHQLRLHPLPRLSREELNTCSLNIAPIIPFSHPGRIE